MQQGLHKAFLSRCGGRDIKQLPISFIWQVRAAGIGECTLEKHWEYVDAPLWGKGDFIKAPQGPSSVWEEDPLGDAPLGGGGGGGEEILTDTLSDS